MNPSLKLEKEGGEVKHSSSKMPQKHLIASQNRNPGICRKGKPSKPIRHSRRAVKGLRAVSFGEEMGKGGIDRHPLTLFGLGERGSRGSPVDVLQL